MTLDEYRAKALLLGGEYAPWANAIMFETGDRYKFLDADTLEVLSWEDVWEHMNVQDAMIVGGSE